MADLKSCETCSYVGKSENDYPCSKCTRNASDMWKPMSNADKIRAMDDEELAEFIDSGCLDCARICPDFKAGCSWTCQHHQGKDFILKWLQSEAE